MFAKNKNRAEVKDKLLIREKSAKQRKSDRLGAHS